MVLSVDELLNIFDKSSEKTIATATVCAALQPDAALPAYMLLCLTAGLGPRGLCAIGGISPRRRTGVQRGGRWHSYTHSRR